MQGFKLVPVLTLKYAKRVVNSDLGPVAGHRYGMVLYPGRWPRRPCPGLSSYRVNEQIAFWQEAFSHPYQPGDYTPDQMRKLCVARIKTRLKRIAAQKNAGRALFELSDYLACLMVIESRN